MLRWIRIAAAFVLILALVVVGGGVGLFVVENSGWVTIDIPSWFHGVLGEKPMEAWLPALLGGWAVAAVALLVLVLWSLFYVWRRRQYERLVSRLERELADMRNLPFIAPAPLEDLPERPDPEIARRLSGADADADGDDEAEVQLA